MQTRRSIVKYISVVLVMGFAVLGAIRTGSISAQWENLPQGDPKTELYFVHPDLLPTTYTPGNEYEFQFSFANKEKRAIDYTFTVVATDTAGKKHTLGTGEATAQHNKIGTVTPSFRMPDMGKRVKVSVILTYTAANNSTQTKAIDFWLDRRGTSTPSGSLG